MKGSAIHDQMILSMAKEYDVFDQERLRAYSKNYRQGNQVKGFVVVPIDLIRNDVNQENNKIIDHMFAVNSDATLVIDYGSETFADGLYNRPTYTTVLPNSIHHISFVGERVENIEDDFLNDCAGLTSIDLSSLARVTKIEDSFLCGCSNLKEVNLNMFSYIESIGNYFLNNCSSLKRVNLSGLKNIQNITTTFLSGCSSLRLIDLSPLTKVTTIGDRFLSDCVSLTSVDLSELKNVTSIGNEFLRNCRGLTQGLNLRDLSRLTKVGYRFLAGCSSLVWVEFGSGITSIGDFPLEGCERLDLVNICNVSEASKSAIVKALESTYSGKILQ